MITIRNEKFLNFTSNGRSEIIAELDVDAASELPASDGLENRRLHQGSVALIIGEGKIAVLGGDGSWYANGEVLS